MSRYGWLVGTCSYARTACIHTQPWMRCAEWEGEMVGGLVLFFAIY